MIAVAINTIGSATSAGNGKRPKRADEKALIVICKEPSSEEALPTFFLKGAKASEAALG